MADARYVTWHGRRRRKAIRIRREEQVPSSSEDDQGRQSPPPLWPSLPSPPQRDQSASESGEEEHDTQTDYEVNEEDVALSDDCTSAASQNSGDNEWVDDSEGGEEEEVESLRGSQDEDGGNGEQGEENVKTMGDFHW